MHKTTTKTGSAARSSHVKLALALVAASLVLAGCSMPKLPKLKIPQVHKISIQQGNVITQDMVDRLKPGMTRSQVAYVMGEPVLRNTFDDTRWDYLYTLDIPGILNQNVHMTLYFEGDALAYFTGDLAPSSATGNSDAEDIPIETAAGDLENAVDEAAGDVAGEVAGEVSGEIEELDPTAGS